ncbi:MFS transporter [Pedobacter caeni]|uniref:Drug resistance transporter, EmrB/QacA subfamily n=1 Tax=Pedobacter caeni TaxID=288992 RepID=A0A1M5A275_9SPHI|nr:MFS transporter [Pedobacter caeni]SHF24361.1 drug resistance transporter, EmrB/QacA subfamily [Pedobacter caeni]
MIKKTERNSSTWWLFASLSLPMLLSSLSTSIANVALPTLVHKFSASFQGVQWVVLAYLLAVTTLIVSVGRLGDLIGRKRLLLFGLFLFTLASALCGLATSLSILIVFRALQGFAAAIMMALSLSFVSEAVPKEKFGRTMGLLGTTSAIGTALGPSLGGFLIAGLSWRAIFFINLPIGLLTFLLVKRYLPADRQGAKVQWSSFDVKGTFLLSLTLAAYALSMTIGHGDYGKLNVLLFLGAVFGLVLFIWTERKADTPLIQLTVFHNLALRAGLVMNVLVSTVMMATLVIGPFYLARGLGLNQAVVGLMMSVGPVISILSGVPAGRIADRLGPLKSLITGLIVMAVGAFTLSAFSADLGIPGYIVAMAVLTPGYQLFQAANNTSVMMDVVPEQRGVMSGLLNLSRNLGLITGASLMGAIFALASGTNEMISARPEAIMTGVRITFAVAGTLVIFALVIAVRLNRRTRHQL